MQKLLGAAFLLVVAAGLAIVAIDRAAMLDRTATRRSLEARGTELAARAASPVSALGCLDAIAGDLVESACEKSVFGTPEAAASALAYVAARLDLLADVMDYAKRQEPGYEARFVGLRRATETDRFGLAAQVLATRDGCTAEKCSGFALVSDATTLRSNLRARVYAQYLDRYRSAWNANAAPSVASVAAPPETKTPSAPVQAAPAAPAPPPVAAAPVQQPSPATASQASAAAPPARPVRAPSSRYDFPSSASIPAISIMAPEPKLPPTPRAEASEKDAAAARQSTSPQTPTSAPPRRPQSQAVAPQEQAQD